MRLGTLLVAATLLWTVPARGDVGSIMAWGCNGFGMCIGYGQCNVPAPDTGFVAVAAGEGHSLGLKADGSIVAWGQCGYGECNVPAPNTGFVAVAGGSTANHSLGLKADGSIVAWGDNACGQCNVPAPNTGFFAVAGGEEHSLGVSSILRGACCQNDGACTMSTEAACSTSNLYQGDGAVCLPNPCPPAGACCASTGTCQFCIQADCLAPNIWQGTGSVCSPNPCLSGACCLGSEGTCRIYPPAECALFSGFYFGNGSLCAPSDTCLTTGVDGPSPAVTRLRVLTAPNPSAGGVVIRCLLPSRAQTSVVLFDASGRVVRRLHDGELPAGETRFSWDGRDDAGREIPAGVYLVRVTTPAGEASGRVVLTQ